MYCWGICCGYGCELGGVVYACACVPGMGKVVDCVVAMLQSCLSSWGERAECALSEVSGTEIALFYAGLQERLFK